MLFSHPHDRYFIFGKENSFKRINRKIAWKFYFYRRNLQQKFCVWSWKGWKSHLSDLISGYKFMFPFSAFVPYHGNFCSMTLVSLKTAYNIKWPSLDIHIAVLPPKISSAKNIESWVSTNNIVEVYPEGLCWSVALFHVNEYWKIYQQFLSVHMNPLELIVRKSSENSRQN